MAAAIAEAFSEEGVSGGRQGGGRSELTIMPPTPHGLDIPFTPGAPVTPLNASTTTTLLMKLPTRALEKSLLYRQTDCRMAYSRSMVTVG